MRKWEELPAKMKCDAVKGYYNILYRHKTELHLKRWFDFVVALLLLCILSPVLAVIGILIKMDSRGPIFFKQIRVTSYGRRFRIWKFRTMIDHADKMGTQVTTKNDKRITRMGHILRKKRLDELPQLFNILKGDMTFVGTRPEVPKYVDRYTDEMLATLLLPAGVTSRTSMEYKDEERLLRNAENADDVYVNEILPEKMKYNLREIEKFSLWRDICTMFKTVLVVLK